MKNTITDTLNLTSSFRQPNKLYNSFNFKTATQIDFVLFVQYITSSLVSGSIVYYLNESFNHSQLYEDDTVCDIIHAIITSSKDISTLHVYSGLHKSKIPEKLKKLLELNLIMTEPTREVVELTDHLDIINSANLLTASWLIRMLPVYNKQLSSISIPEDTVCNIFKSLESVQSYDYRLGVKNYGPYIAYLGTDNIPSNILNNRDLKKTLLGMDHDGKVYKTLKENLGDDIDYFIQLTKLGGLIG